LGWKRGKKKCLSLPMEGGEKLKLLPQDARSFEAQLLVVSLTTSRNYRKRDLHTRGGTVGGTQCVRKRQNLPHLLREN